MLVLYIPEELLGGSGVLVVVMMIMMMNDSIIMCLYVGKCVCIYVFT